MPRCRPQGAGWFYANRPKEARKGPGNRKYTPEQAEGLREIAVSNNWQWSSVLTPLVERLGVTPERAQSWFATNKPKVRLHGVLYDVNVHHHGLKSILATRYDGCACAGLETQEGLRLRRGHCRRRNLGRFAARCRAGFQARVLALLSMTRSHAMCVLLLTSCRLFLGTPRFV